jgi:cell division protein FtsQ
MPAVARKKPAPRSPKVQVSAKPNSQVKVQRNRGGKRPPSTSQAPRKIEATHGAGLAPKVALGVAAAAILGVAALALLTGERFETLKRGTDRTSNAVAGALGFGLSKVELRGVSEPHARQAILAAAGVERGDNILTLDLPGMRDRVDAVVWADEVSVQRLLPETLVITVEERRPVAVWQFRGRVGLVDDKGRVIAGAPATDFPQLPLAVGAGANEAIGDILPVLHSRPQLMAKVEALVRVDRRRWDLRLRDGALIQLPALDEEDALMRLDQLEQRARVLELGFEKIDLRDPQLVAVRPRADQPSRPTGVPTALGASAPAPIAVAQTTPIPAAPAVVPSPLAAPAAPAGL